MERQCRTCFISNTHTQGDRLTAPVLGKNVTPWKGWGLPACVSRTLMLLGLCILGMQVAWVKFASSPQVKLHKFYKYSSSLRIPSHFVSCKFEVKRESVPFEDPRDADDALYHLDRSRFYGRELEVEFARGDRKTPSQMRSKERGSRYGRRSRSRSPRFRSIFSRSRSRSPYYRHRSRSYSPRDRRRRSRSGDSRKRSHTRSRSHSNERRHKSASRSVEREKSDKKSRTPE